MEREMESPRERQERIHDDLIEVECEALGELDDEELVQDLKEKCGLSDEQIKAVLERFEPICENIAEHAYWYARESEGLVEER